MAAIEASIAGPRQVASGSCALRTFLVIAARSALLTIQDQKVPSWRASGAIGITSVIYVEDVDGVGVFIDRIADAVLAAPGSPLSLEGLAQEGSDSAWLFAERAANELETGPRDDFG